MTESKLQISVMQYLDTVLPSTIRAAHVPNGGARDARTGARLKREGVKAGFPDIALTGAFHGFIELKVEGGRLSPVQRDWLDFLAAQNVPVSVCRSVQDVRETLAEWGITTREAA